MKAEKKPNRFKSAVRSWLGVEDVLSSGHGDFVGNAAGQHVNEKSILGLSAVWACTRLISETISTLPLGIYERGAQGRVKVTNHPLHSILSISPNADSTASVYWEAMIASMLLRGNGISEKQMIGNRLIGLKFLQPSRVTTDFYNGKRRWFYTERAGVRREIPDNRIFRIPGFTLDGHWGLSAIEYGASVFGSALAASSAANSTFEKGLSPTVAFKTELIVKKEQREEFRENMAEVSGAINAGKSPILEGGMSAEAIGIDPKDAQLLESRAFSIEEICRWFRIPPHMVGHSQKSTSWGTGIEQQMIGFLTFTLRTWLKRIEEHIYKDLFSFADKDRYYAEYSVEGLLRADSNGRADFLEKMTRSGLMTLNEGRAKENLPPKDGNADVLMVNSATQPIDSLGIQNEQAPQ